MTDIKPFFQLDFLQNIQKYQDSVVGIKLSGKCLADLAMRRNIVRQIIELKTLNTQVAVVIGAGPQITEESEKIGIKKREIQGLRYTSIKELEIADRCMSSLIRDIAKDFYDVSSAMGLKTPVVALPGYHQKLIVAGLHSPDFEGSRTGRVLNVDTESLHSYMGDSVVILNSICAGEDGGRWNVNADDVIEAVARTSHAKLVVMCSDTAFYDKNKITISRLFTDQIQAYVDDGTFNDKLAPKVRAAQAIADHVCPVSVVNGAEPNAIDLELYTEQGSGTRIERRPEPWPEIV